MLGCIGVGVWLDEDTDKVYCGKCLIYVAPDAPADAEKRREVREEIGDEIRGERFDADARRSW
jgi:hypothetical protein